MEPSNRWQCIVEWKRRRTQSKSSRYGARARLAGPGCDKGEWGVGGGEREDEGGVEQKKYSGREGGRERGRNIYNKT